MNKFLLAENPMRPEQSGLWIIHLLDPQAIIKCDEDHLEFEPGKFYKHFSFKNSDEIVEYWTLSVHFMFTRELDSEQHSAIVDQMLSRAWRWYRAYMEWEDKNTEI